MLEGACDTGGNVELLLPGLDSVGLGIVTEVLMVGVKEPGCVTREVVQVPVLVSVSIGLVGAVEMLALGIEDPVGFGGVELEREAEPGVDVCVVGFGCKIVVGPIQLKESDFDCPGVRVT